MRTITAANAILDAIRQKPARNVQGDAPLRVTLQPLQAYAQAPQTAGGMKKALYEDELVHWQSRIGRAVRDKAFQRSALVLVFEGQDAAGKGGAIRRVTAALDVRNFDIHPIAAPNAEERARPYLWRFWRRLPGHGKVTIFDRSWYGRVLVERVEKLSPANDIRRAYDEINDFELQLTANGTQVLKFWLDVSKDEQLKRFKEREESPFKSFKITEEDWRNRAKWNAYQRARHDMLTRTNTKHAPWHTVQSDDKRAARIHILKVIALTLEGLNHRKPLQLEPDIRDQANDLS